MTVSHRICLLNIGLRVADFADYKILQIWQISAIQGRNLISNLKNKPIFTIMAAYYRLQTIKSDVVDRHTQQAQQYM